MKGGDALDATLAAADAGASAPPPGPDAAVPAVASEADQWTAFAQHVGGILRAMLPVHVAPHWTPERLHAVGVELANVARHYGWTFGAALDHPLARLAFVSWPLAWPLIEPYLKKPAAIEGEPAKAAPIGEAGDATKATGKIAPIDG